jgi:hypothetical protein
MAYLIASRPQPRGKPHDGQVIQRALAAHDRCRGVSVRFHA